MNISISTRRLSFATLSISLFVIASAPAAPLVVSTTANAGTGSLRQAISASPAGGSIEFNIPTSQPGYDASTGVFTITLAAEIEIGRDLIISGPTNAKVAISANNVSRVFTVIAGTVSISNLTIRDGYIGGAAGTNDPTGDHGGGPGGDVEGGGISNAANLTLTNCTLVTNSLRGGTGGASKNGSVNGPGGNARGGAIVNSGTLALVRCVLYGNAAYGGNGGTNSSGAGSPGLFGNGGAGSGGGISNVGTLSLVNCTIASGVAAGGTGGDGGSQSGSGGSASGGGIANEGTLTLTNCTVDANAANPGNGGAAAGQAGSGGSAAGGGLYQSAASGSSTLHNAIVTNNVVTAGLGGSSMDKKPGANGVAAGPDVDGTVKSQGHNLIGRSDASSGWSGTDLLGGTTTGTKLDPLLGALQDNGGPTLTKRPMAGSAAIDNGDDSVLSAPLGLTSDQRLLPRKIGAHIDIGAVEVGVTQPGPAFTVTNTANRDDGACSQDNCTLIDALNAANASSDANTINFAPGVTGKIETLIKVGLAVSNPVTISGPGARVLAIAGDDNERIFNVSAPNVVISGLTIRNGYHETEDGGGILNTGGLTLEDCTLTANHAVNSGNGGAVFNPSGAMLTLVRCTIAKNGAGQFGGGVANNGVLVATNCTFSGNTASRGGGIITRYNGGLSSATLRNCTITNNTATSTSGGPGDGGGGYYAEGGAQQEHIGNTIIAGNINSVNPDVRGQFTSDGHNLIGQPGSSTGFGVNGDIVGTNTTGANPQFGTFGDHDGPTNTWSLLSTSPAINKGDNKLAPSQDQRGYFRSGISDIGAFELNGVAPVPPAVATLAATNVTATTVTLKATVNPNGLSTSFHFTSDFRSFTAQNAGSGTATVPLSVNVTGLTPGTQYHFNTVATNAAGTAEGVQGSFTTSHSATPTPTATATPKPTATPTSTPHVSPTATPAGGPSTLGNISTRVRVETGNNVLIGGFIVTGTQPKKVLIRAIGPSIPVSGALANPTVELYSGPTLLETNDNWGDSPEKQAIIATTIPPSSNLESAIVRTLPANNSAYTAIVRGVNNGTGVGLVEVYDLDRAADSKLANISTRGLVQTEANVMIGGFIVLNGNQKVIVRAIGPSLPVSGALQDPVLELHNSNGAVLQSNDNWKTGGQQAEIIATTVPPSNDRESAIVRTLAPGNYTAVVRGVNNTTGVALVEVFALQ